MVPMKDEMYYAAATAIGIAAAIHLFLASSLLKTSFFQFGEFFVIVGVCQAFWVIPTLKKYGIVWMYVGIGGNIALFILWLVTRMPNPITRIGLPINAMGITEEIFQLAYVAIVMALAYMSQKDKLKNKEETSTKNE